MSDDIEALPDVWLHNLPHHLHHPSTPHIPVVFSDGFVVLPQNDPLNDRIFIIVLFSQHSPPQMRARVAFGGDRMTQTLGN